MKNEPINPITGDGAISIGLTKREYFAAMAMQGMLANSYDNGYNTQPLSTANSEQIAMLAVHQADELIKELEKVNEN